MTRCTAITTTAGKQCRRDASDALVWRFDWRPFCAQHVERYLGHRPIVRLPIRTMSPWLRGEDRTPPAPTTTQRWEWAVYQQHVLAPTTTPHLTDPLSDAIAHGYSGTLD